VLIPDEIYSPDMEEQTVSRLFFSPDDKAEFRNDPKFKAWCEKYKPFEALLTALQSAHDHPRSPVVLNQALKYIQDEFALADFEPIAVWEGH
jgi:hypothetical protein